MPDTYSQKPWIKHYDEGIPAVIDYPQVPIDWFLKDAADKYPDRSATVFGARVGPLLLDSTINYKELNRAVNRFASGLQKMGVKKGGRVRNPVTPVKICRGGLSRE